MILLSGATKVAAAMYAVSDEAKQFGILGGFAEDANLLKEIRWCQDVYTPAVPDTAVELSATSPLTNHDLENLVALLDILPSAGRNALVTQILARSPFRDKLLQDLFDHCLVPRADNRMNEDEFVLALTNSTLLVDTRKYLVIKVVLLLLSFCNVEVAVEVSRRYLRSASTRHQGAFLAWCTKQPQEAFSDDELWEFYRESPVLVQETVLSACKACCSAAPTDGSELQCGNPLHPREAFLRKVLQSSSHNDPNLLFLCSSACVEATLFSAKDDALLQEVGMRKWSFHAHVYIKFLRSRLHAVTSPLERGRIWTRLKKSLPSASRRDLKPQHIHALVALLAECNPMKVAVRLPKNVRNLLEGLANEGQDIIKYEAVEPVVLDASLLAVIPKRERVNSALKSVAMNDFKTFFKHKSVVKYDLLPFEDFFMNASSDMLWDNVSGRLAKKSRKTDTEKFSQHFFHSDFTQSSRRSFTIDALWAWQQWHLRATPNKLSIEQRRLYARAGGVDDDDENCADTEERVLQFLWRIWFDSLKSRFLDNGLMDCITHRVMDAKASHRPQERSRITLDARYADEIVGLAMQGILALPDNVISNSAMVGHLKTLLGLYKMLPFNHLMSVKMMNDALGKTALDEFIPRLGNMLDFDPTTADGERSEYLSQLGDFEQNTRWIAERILKQDEHSADLKVLLAALEDVLSRATAGDRHLPLKSGMRYKKVENPTTKRIKFAYYEDDKHRIVIKNVLSIVDLALRRTKTRRRRHEEHSYAWELMSRYEFATLDGLTQLDRYLKRCVECLSYAQLDAEKERILKHVKEAARLAKRKKGAEFIKKFGDVGIWSSLLRMGLLPDVLSDSKVCSQGEKNAVLMQTMDFGFDVVQAFLKQETEGINGEKRKEGQLALLRSAFSFDDEGRSSGRKRVYNVADALAFTVQRIRNEPGLYRREIFDYIALNLSQVVNASLDNSSHPGTLAAVRRITTKLEEMMKNDQGRRDLVGHLGSFKRFSQKVIKGILDHGQPTRNRVPSTTNSTEMRQLWISFAVKVDCLQTMAKSGTQGLVTCRWEERQWRLESSHLVSSESFDKSFPRPESLNQITKLRERVSLFDIVANEELKGFLGPSEFVSLLCRAYEVVWDEKKLPCGLLSWPGEWVPEDCEVRTALLTRLQALYGLSDIAWEEVPQLVDAFDRTMSGLDADCVPHHHRSFASDLLQCVLEIYGIDATHYGHKGVEDFCYFYEIPRLSNAVESMLSCHLRHHDTGMKWHRLYCAKILEQGLRDWDRNPVQDARFSSFLVKHCKGGCEPPWCRLVISNEKEKKIDRANRRCVLARELLAMSPSEWWIEEVRNAIEYDRQDLAARYLTDRMDFATDDNVDKSLSVLLHTSKLVKFSPRICGWLAARTLNLAMNPDVSIQVRVQAIEDFCAVPSTGYQDVINSLKEEALCVGPLQEAITVKMFSLDSPWPVISFILNSSFAEDANRDMQRMAAMLLGHITKYVEVEKVVNLLGMLLHQKRRANLRMVLHKATIRALLDNRTPLADEILQSEFQRPNLPVGITHIMVQRCVINVAAARETSAVEWEWEILNVLVAKAKVAPLHNDVLLLMFKLTWGNFAAETILNFFRSAGPSGMDTGPASSAENWKFFQRQELEHTIVSNPETCQKYHRLLKSVEDCVADPFWKVLTKAYRLSFTVSGDSEESAAAVGEMKDFLCLSVEETESPQDVDKCAVGAIAYVFGKVCMESLATMKKTNPEKSYASICDESQQGSVFRECFRHLLTNVLDTPTREVARRERFVTALIQMSTQSFNSEVWHCLVGRKYAPELELVAGDVELLRELDRTARDADEWGEDRW